MKIKNLIFTLIGRACTICVSISVLFFTVAQIASYVRMEGELGISFSQYLLFVLFSFILAGASYLFRLRLPKALNFFIHFAVCLFSFLVTFIASGKLVAVTPSSILVFSAIFALLYLIVFGVFLLIRHTLSPRLKSEENSKKNQAEANYQKRF